MTLRKTAEQFAALSRIPGIAHAFTGREPGIDVQVDREEALQRLEAAHTEIRAELGLAQYAFCTAKQVHGKVVARVTAACATALLPEADGLITNDPHVCLGIYTADCGPVFLVDPVRRAIGLVHSGRKGSELGITAEAIRRMGEEFGTQPADLVVQLAPCIRPPHYEVDFAAMILEQARAAGVQQVDDCGTCTAAAPERYYSYRREMGKTGRMVALLALV